MNKLPERIWLSNQPDYWENNLGTVFTLKNGSHDIEYIRADLYKDAKAEIARLTAELREAEDRANLFATKEMHTEAWGKKAELERDHALARAAAAAMEMRERAADASGHYMSDEVDELLLDMWREDIRALPIDPDAQKALDEMLANARLEGWQAGRDAAARSCVLSGQDLAEGDWGPEGRDMAVMLEARILARPEPKENSHDW